MAVHEHGTPLVDNLRLNGTGTVDATGDYSAAEVEFYIQPSYDQSYVIKQVILHIGDEKIDNMAAYGDMPALTNGIYAFVADPIKDLWRFPVIGQVVDNHDFSTFVHLHTLEPLKPTVLYVVFDFVEKTGSPVTLSGQREQRFGLRLNDDFTGLTEHVFFVYGVSS
jgi:hypothetical protein